jgi:tetratricopeptide (TPR) repeat protein
MKTAKHLLVAATSALLLVILPAGCNKEAKAASKLNAAREHFEKADYPAAEIEYKTALSLEPGHPEALKGLGLVLLRQGAMLDGGRVLEAAKSQLPADDEIGVGLALAKLDLGFVADSRTEVMEVLTRTPAHGEALMLLAEASLTPEAMTECEERLALAKSPDQAPVLLASALVEHRRGKSEAGAADIARALEIDPKSARAHALQGRLHMENKRPGKAVESLKKASDLAGPRSTERCSYATLLMGLERQDEAIAVLKEATQAAPDYLPNWRLLGRIAFVGGKDAEATEYLAKVLAKSPLDIDAGLLQSELWLRGKEPAKAIELLEQLTKTFPSKPALKLALGKAHLAADDSRKAAELLDRVLAEVPGSTEALQLRANLYLKDGQPAEVIRLVEPLHAAAPQNRMAQDLLLAAYRATNRDRDAIEILRQQVAALPNEPGPQLQLGQLLAAQGKTAEARAALERVLAFAPDQLAAVGQLVALDEREGKSDAATARIDAYLSAHPESPQAYYLKAGLCYSRKDYQAAEALIEKTIELMPDDTKAYGMLVRIQTADGRSDEAIGRLKQLLAANPRNVAALMHLGTLYQELGRTAEARACAEEILKISPNFAPAHNNLAYIDSITPGKLDQAREHARKARTLDPGDPSICDTCGWIEWLSGDYRQALPLLLESASRLPDAAQVQYHLAMTHYMMHQVPEAVAAFERALAIPGGFPEKDQAAAHLATLRDGDKLDLPSLEQRLKDSPRDVVLLVLKAGKLAAAGRPEDAAAAYQGALAVNPDLEAAYLGLAELYSAALNQPGKALEAANQARKIAPQSPRAAAALGTLNFRLGKHEDAFNLLQEAARKIPDDPGVQYDFAWAAYGTGRVTEARAAMAKLTPATTAHAADAKDFLALTAPDAVGDVDLPALIESKLAANPPYVPALMVRAALQEKAGESPVATYAKVLEIFPQFDPARIALARVYLDDPTQLEAAEKLASAARERRKDDPDLSGILAIINFRNGQFDYAAQLLTELSSQRPLTGRELFALGMSQAATKHPAEARQALTLALQANLPTADAATARATLANLDKPNAPK